jgi:repressor LexA
MTSNRESALEQPLTKRQRAVFEFIRDKIQNRGYGPTVREIGERFRISSPNGVMCHLKALEKKGLITREPNMSRAIQLVGKAKRESSTPSSKRRSAVDSKQQAAEGFELPLVGRVAAGVFHEAIEQSDRINFGTMFAKDDQFVLQVRGDSMIDAQIADGDFVVVRKQAVATNGQMVVAQTPDGEATLKYWFAESDRIRLQPANSNMQPIFTTDAQVLGVIVGVVRRLD